MKSEKNISSNSGQAGKAVVNLPTQHPFQVPSGYFEQFPEHILNLIQDETSLEFATNKENPLSVPENYFEDFSINLLDRIKKDENPLEELESIAPSLVSLKSENPFSVPEGYFNSFTTHNLPQKHKFTVVIGIKQIMRFAVAACLIGAVLFVYWGNENKLKGTDQPIAIKSNPAEISTEAISSYLNGSEPQIESTENDDLATNGMNLLVNIDKETVSMVLSEISENDIQQYLQQTVNIENKIN